MKHLCLEPIARVCGQTILQGQASSSSMMSNAEGSLVYENTGQSGLWGRLLSDLVGIGVCVCVCVRRFNLESLPSCRINGNEEVARQSFVDRWAKDAKAWEFILARFPHVIPRF